MLECQRLKEKIENWQGKLDERITLTKDKQESLSSYKNHLFEKIDLFFDEYILKVNQRRDQLKD